MKKWSARKTIIVFIQWIEAAWLIAKQNTGNKKKEKIRRR
jgi:hypothetical protein